MEITKGDKTVADYIMKGGLQEKVFSYGWQSRDGQPALYRVEGISLEDHNVIMDVVRIDKNAEGKRGALALYVHKDDLEVIIS